MSEKASEAAGWVYYVLHESGPPVWRVNETTQEKWNAETKTWEFDQNFMGWLLEGTSIDEVSAAEAAEMAIV
jgi:hypothetical protein